MAKTTSPLHSLTAAGTYGRTITFQGARGPLATIKRHTTRTAPPTALQIATRNAIAEITAALRWINRTAYLWQITNTTPRAVWIAAAPDPSEWQNFYQRTALGPMMSEHAVAKAHWIGMDPGVKADYAAIASQVRPAIRPVPQRYPNGQPAPNTEPAEILFLIEWSAYVAGLRPTDPTVFPANYTDPNTPQGSTIWDAGATTWDAGATYWD